MRFVVDFYRLVLFGSLALLLVGAGFLAVLVGLGGYVLDPSLDVPALAGIVAAAVVTLGLLSTSIAIHDRLADLADRIDRIADRLDASVPHRGDGDD